MERDAKFASNNGRGMDDVITPADVVTGKTKESKIVPL